MGEQKQKINPNKKLSGTRRLKPERTKMKKIQIKKMKPTIINVGIGVIAAAIITVPTILITNHFKSEESNTQLNITTKKSALTKAQEIYAGHAREWLTSLETMISNGVPLATIETVKESTFAPFQDDYDKAVSKNAK